MIGSGAASAAPDFGATLRAHAVPALRREAAETLQVNVGKLCNQACHHCHVGAGPQRTEIMTRATAERIDELLRRSPEVRVLDLTGGAPELNPNFRWLVKSARARGSRVMVRCNLTVMFVEGQEDLPEFYRQQEVELVCSLPCYTAENVDGQRGRGVFGRSIEALRVLNDRGYGGAGSALVLNLVHNPGGAFLPSSQSELEARYREELRALLGVEFHRLLTIANMPIGRFADQLHHWAKYDEYMGLLVNHFNPAAASGVMCRSLVSVGWDGTLYDCDFNQMLHLAIPDPAGRPLTLWDIERIGALDGRDIRVAAHCFGCTAGAGSSCGGALES